MVTVGLVGLGFIGKTHLKAYRQIEGCRVKSIYVRDVSRVDEDVQEFAREHDITFVETYEKLLHDEEIDVIDICLPTYLHEKFVIDAARAGKHIFCEKPLSLSVESARRMMAEVMESGVQLYVGHVLRFWPEYVKIKEVMGHSNVKIVHAVRLGQKPTWSEWFQDPHKSGGALFDLHIHDIDFMTYLQGEVATVYAVGHKNNDGAWEHVMTTLRFENGATAFVEASHRMPVSFPFTMSLRLLGERGTVDFRVEAGENIESVDDGQTKFVYYDEAGAEVVQVNDGDAFANELAYFVDCIRGRKENTIIPLDDVIYTMEILEAIEESLNTGEEVVL